MQDTDYSRSMTAKKPVPGRGWYVVAVFLFVAGALGGIALLFTTIFSSLTGGTQFLVPGGITISVGKAGTYTLWNETSAVYNGKMFSGDRELPGNLVIRVYDTLTDEPVSLKSSASARESFGSRVRYAVSDIAFEKPGEYRIEVSGDFSTRVFMIRRSVCGDILIAFLLFIPMSIIGWIAAPVIFVVVLVKRMGRKEIDEASGSHLQAMGEDRAVPETSVPQDSERTWATFCHLSALSGYFVPFANIIAPLILWLIKKDEYPLVKDQGRESLNFQISMMLYALIASILMIVLVGFLLLIGLGIFNLIVVIIATVKANKGERYRYPLCIRFIR